MIWPFNREKRARGDYTDQRVREGRRRVRTGDLKTEALGAVEAVAGFCERTMAGLTVADQAIRPDVMGWLARSLILRGEAILLPQDGHFLQVTDFEVHGGLSPESWVFRLSLEGPTRTTTEYAPYQDLVFLRMNADPRFPWRGRPAWRTAELTANAAVAMEQAVDKLMRIPPYTVLPVDARLKSVSGLSLEQWRDLADSRREALEDSSLVMQPVEGGSAGGLGGQVNNPDPSVGTGSVRSEIRADLIQACGLPAVIFDPRVTGPSLREGIRVFEHSWLHPVAMLIKAEFARIGRPVEISISGRFGGELQARSRALKTAIDAGVPIDQAREMTGL